MKNKTIEHKIKNAKRYAKTWGSTRKLNEHGHYIIHSYDEPKTLSWWDDVFFKLGSQVIAVWWIHPRQHYLDLCETQIDEQMPFPQLSHDEMFTRIPNYKKLGKNGKRKKVVSYTTKTNPEFSKHCKLRQQALDDLLKTSDIIAKPFIKIHQYDWCRGVSLCLPMEVLNENDVNELAHIAKKLMTRQITLDELFPNYQYSKDDWLKEQ